MNTGCIPTKTLVASAYVAYKARTAAFYGVNISGPVTVDIKAVKARKDEIVGKSRLGVEDWLRSMQNCTVYDGHARFESARSIRVGDEIFSAEEIFINAGGRAVIPELPEVGQLPHLTNSTILELDTLPRHLIVVGGSYVGLEFAQIYRRFGSEVTVVEKFQRLISHEDEDVSAAVKDILESEGIAVRLGAERIRLTPHPDGVAVFVECASDASDSIGSHVLLAMGRRPNTDDLNLEAAWVEMDSHWIV